MADGRIVDFRTTLTGEVFAQLRGHAPGETIRVPADPPLGSLNFAALVAFGVQALHIDSAAASSV